MVGGGTQGLGKRLTPAVSHQSNGFPTQRSGQKKRPTHPAGDAARAAVGRFDQTAVTDTTADSKPGAGFPVRQKCPRAEIFFAKSQRQMPPTPHCSRFRGLAMFRAVLPPPGAFSAMLRIPIRHLGDLRSNRVGLVSYFVRILSADTLGTKLL